jgi:LPXTG-motif cell wall-anchored protein
MALLLSGLASTPSAGQTIVDQPVRFTFSAPITLPGMTLPAGQYEFKLTRSASDRQIVQVFDDKGKSHGMLAALAAVRTDGQPVPQKPEITFMETPENMPQAVKVYWYPGIRSGGHEFIYPRAQAQLIARTSKTTVLTTTGADASSGTLTRMSANGESADLNAQDTHEAAPAVAPPSAPPPAPVSMEANASNTAPRTRRALPKTGSELPLIAAIGFVALFSGVALIRRRQIA